MNFDIVTKRHLEYIVRQAGGEPLFIGYNHIDSRATSFDPSLLKDYSIAIGYDDFHKVFAAWNLLLHQQHHHGINCTLSTKQAGVKYIRTIESFESRYKSLHNGSGDYEKVMLISIDSIEEFCHFHKYYLCPDEIYPNYNSKALHILENGTIVRHGNAFKGGDQPGRKRVAYTRLERRPHFRKKVLESYGNKCAICRCDEVKVLEAAHIDDVQYSNDDEAKNGICLCANHHQMYDQGLITFDFEKSKLSYVSDTVKNMAWYFEFVDKFKGEIIEQKL